MADKPVKKKSPMLEEHIAALEKIRGKSVEAGWFETNRYQKGPRVSDKMVGTPVARIARIQEFGAVIKREGYVITIPARPFMRLAAVTFNGKRKEIQKKIAGQMATGKINPEQGLKQIGMAMEAEIVKSIKTGGWERNAESTIRKKGFDDPLIDSGTMWQTVTSAVVDETQK